MLCRNKGLATTTTTTTNQYNNNNTQNNKFLPNDEECSKLSCYSDQYPPERDTVVVMQVDRVDQTGVWGWLVDWGRSFEAYLPIGSIGKEKGRGERKAQAHFLTKARRSLKGARRPQGGMTIVVLVQSVEAVSQTGVAQGLATTGFQFRSCALAAMDEFGSRKQLVCA